MREDLLHFIWKYKKLQMRDLVTSKSQSIVIFDTGIRNHHSGPDFFNAKIEIDGQLWAGNVEMHLKSSDWYAHHHEKDPNYDNVILHVVWEDDITVFRNENGEVPTLELKHYIPVGILANYQQLLDQKGKQFINCERDILAVDSLVIQNWLERLYFERLERKSKTVFDLLEQSKNDWEQVLFIMLLKSFNINGDSFFSLAKAISFSIVRKIRHDRLQLESLLMGMSGLLSVNEVSDIYFERLAKEYVFLKSKFKLEEEKVRKPEFYKLRPANFPTVRLSQLAGVYANHKNLFHKVIDAKELDQLYAVLEVSASSYWNDHFTFGKKSKKSIKALTHTFIDLLIINTVVPLKFAHAKYLGRDNNEAIVNILSKIKKEKNSIIQRFEVLKMPFANAMDTQAALQLYSEYCTKNKCVQCAIGSSLLNGK